MPADKVRDAASSRGELGGGPQPCPTVALPPPLPHAASPTLWASALSALMASRKTGVRHSGWRDGEASGGGVH